MQTKVICGKEEMHTAVVSQKHSSGNDFPVKKQEVIKY
jgi:hypothetical protein